MMIQCAIGMPEFEVLTSGRRHKVVLRRPGDVLDPVGATFEHGLFHAPSGIPKSRRAILTGTR